MYRLDGEELPRKLLDAIGTINPEAGRDNTWVLQKIAVCLAVGFHAQVRNRVF